MSALSRTCRIQHFHAIFYAYRLILRSDRVFLQNAYVSNEIYVLIEIAYLIRIYQRKYLNFTVVLNEVKF